MYVQKFERRGFIIYENVSDKFEGTTYCTVVNLQKRMKNDPCHHAHIHVDNKKAAFDVIDYICKKIPKNQMKRINKYIKTKARQLLTGIPYYRI